MPLFPGAIFFGKKYQLIFTEQKLFIIPVNTESSTSGER
jgi:hypothetical protein